MIIICRTVLLLLLLRVNFSNASLLNVWSDIFSLDHLSQLISTFISNGQPSLPPETWMTTLEIVHYYGFRHEYHRVATKDGYLLEMHRVLPLYNNSKAHPVLLQHGFLGSSSHFVLNGKFDSLALVLAREGFDVWMGNIRGNFYSRRHLQKSPDRDDSFWDFSLDELALQDLPAMMDYILQTTKQPQLSYIGHSMGTTISAMFLSKNKNYCHKMRKTIWLAPVIYADYAKTGLRILQSNHRKIRSLLDLVYGKEVFWAPKWLKDLIVNLCSTSIGMVAFEFVLGIFSGFSEELLNREYLPVLVAHGFEGTSWWIIMHFIQIFNEGRLASFDWNPITSHNKYIYSPKTVYNLGDIECPVNVFWGKMDLFIDSTDMIKLSRDMKNLTVEELVDAGSKYFAHHDFISSKNAYHNQYKKIIQLIKQGN